LKIQDNIYSDTYQLHIHQADPLLTAELPFYCRAVQEGAAAHAHYEGCANSDLHAMGKTWVLSRLKLTIEKYVTWPSAINFKTWINSPFRFFAPREARGTDEDGNELFRSMAYWVVIDLEKRRPEKPGIINDFIGLSEDRSLWTGTTLSKLSAGQDLTNSNIYKPQLMYRDIDSVRHINNISYIEWILESFPLEYKTDFKPSEFEINFLAESFLGDELILFSKQESDEHDNTWQHTIIRVQGDVQTEICRARSIWKKREYML
jgi:acyl-ACP thioesterase